MELTTKEKIIEAAVDLFSKKGFNGVSIREITKEVGIKESSLYNHFKSKEELLDVIFEMFLSEVGKTSFDLNLIEEGLNQMDISAFLQHHAFLLRKQTTPIMAKIWKIIYMEQFRDERVKQFVLNEIMKRPYDFYKKTFQIALEKNMIKTKNLEMLVLTYQYTALTLTWEQMLQDNDDLTPMIKKRYDLIKYSCEGE